MSIMKEVFTEIQYMMVYGTKEQKQKIQSIVETHQDNQREMQKHLIEFVNEDCMSRN